MSDIILGMILGMALLALLAYVYIRLLLNRMVDNLDKHIKEAVDTLMPLKVERENGIIYCYNNDDNTFICQGTNAQEIRAAVRKLYPEKTAFLAAGDESLLGELREELKELKKDIA